MLKKISFLIICLILFSSQGFAKESWSAAQHNPSYEKYFNTIRAKLTDKETQEQYREIQRTVVKANPDLLNFKDGIHKTWLKPLILDQRGGKRSSAYYSDGTITIFDDIMNDKLDYDFYIGGIDEKTNHIPTKNESDVYGRSMVAWTIAHETGHYLQETRNEFKYNKNIEVDADMRANYLLMNTRDYSFGVAYVGFKQLDEKYEYSEEVNKSEEERHPDSDVRMRAISNMIEKLSNGRVLTDDRIPNAFSVDGISCVAPPIEGETSAVVRALYAQGNIAYAMAKGIWSLNNIYIKTENEIFHNKKDRLVLVVKDNNAYGYKIIDKFNLTTEDAEDMLKNSNYDTNERMYFYEILSKLIEDAKK